MTSKTERLEKVTTWSAETADGKIYAEKKPKGRKWRIWAKRRLLTEVASFKAAQEYVEAIKGMDR